MKFKVGDRVRGEGEFDNVNLTNLTGTIKKVTDSLYSVEWDTKSNDFWNCSGYCNENSGYNCPARNLRLLTIDNWKAYMEREL